MSASFVDQDATYYFVVEFDMLSILRKLNRPTSCASQPNLPLPDWVPDLTDKELQRELESLRTGPRYQTRTTQLLGPPLQVVDGRSFYYSFLEIFSHRIYEFSAKNRTPNIVDGGSNIGLSIIWFKQRYPDSTIVGFEADGEVFKVLEQNIQAFGLNGVHVIQRALSDQDGELEFAVEGADGGRLSEGGGLEPGYRQVVRVPASRLSPWLDRPVDMLKLDIEGAEYRVLKECSGHLSNVRHIFVEYHSFVEQPQRLDEIFKVLKDAGFRVQIHSQFSSPQPLIRRSTQLGMDLQLNIFGYRPT